MELPMSSRENPTAVAEDWVGRKDLIWVSETWTQEKAMKSSLETFSHASSYFFTCLSLQKYFFKLFSFFFIQWNSPECNTVCSAKIQSPGVMIMIHNLNFIPLVTLLSTLNISENADSVSSVCVIFPLLIYFTNALVQIYLSPSHAYEADPVTSCKQRHHNTEEKH